MCTKITFIMNQNRIIKMKIKNSNLFLKMINEYTFVHFIFLNVYICR